MSIELLGIYKHVYSLRVVIDAANGAAYHCSLRLLRDDNDRK